MALTFTDVRTILRSRLSEASASAWTDAELQDYLYLAELKVLLLLPSDAFWEIQEIEETVETGTNGYVALPSTVGMQQLVNASISITGSGNLSRLRVIEPGRTSEYAASSTDPVAWFEDGKFYFSPRLSELLTHTIRFRYTPMATEGAIIVPDRLIEYVISWAYALAIERESAQLAAVEKNEFYQNIKAISDATYGLNKLNRGR